MRAPRRLGSRVHARVNGPEGWPEVRPARMMVHCRWISLRADSGLRHSSHLGGEPALHFVGLTSSTSARRPGVHQLVYTAPAPASTLGLFLADSPGSSAHSAEPAPALSLATATAAKPRAARPHQPCSGRSRSCRSSSSASCVRLLSNTGSPRVADSSVCERSPVDVPVQAAALHALGHLCQAPAVRAAGDLRERPAKWLVQLCLAHGDGVGGRCCRWVAQWRAA